MKIFCLKIQSGYDVDEAWKLLQKSNIIVLYSSESNGEQEIYVQEGDIPKFDFIKSINHQDLQQIDWEQQWAEHGLDYYDGLVHVDLSSYGFKTVLLKPGPGFGDLSHPTTLMMIKMMAPYIKKQRILDIGCGSGVLSICAKAMVAKEVVGVDIDEPAVEHAKANAILNKMKKNIQFGLVTEKKDYDLVLMNMIMSEQKEAWSFVQPKAKMIITSGIRIEEREKYLNLTQSWGWEPFDEIDSEDWLCLCFKIK